ncbi:fasciclin domain-containing protein [Methylobacterium sp. BTF04]|nr:fasciclin domain-containing protein [Methylobacterium sp. BTF04]
MRTTLTAALFASGLAFAVPAFAETSLMVGGAPMMASKTIGENASKASNLTTLVAAVKAAGLVDALSGPGPFTVFAPTNAAFAKLPAGTVDTLLKPDMKKTLTAVLTYHVVAGKLDAKALMAKAKMSGADANLTTVEGEVLTVKMDGDRLALIDQKGGGAVVEQRDVFQSNGVVHVIDSVLMPK